MLTTNCSNWPCQLCFQLGRLASLLRDNEWQRFTLLLPLIVPCSLFLLLSLLLTQPHSMRISQNSVALRSVVPVLILEKFDMRDEICGSWHDSRYDLKTSEFSRVSIVLSRSPIHPSFFQIPPPCGQIHHNSFVWHYGSQQRLRYHV